MSSEAVRLNVTPQKYNEVKLAVIKSFISLLSKDIDNPEFDTDQQESLTVAKQCLQAIYEVSDEDEEPANLMDLFIKNNIEVPPTGVQLSPEVVAEAEEHKRLGNECMKINQFEEALTHYTQAIKLNPKKAIYYCNRAACFSRLERHNESVRDCKDAIKLDPNYGKAYGRLGIAYSHLNMLKEAIDAYKKALELDPNNETYESNMKLAESQLTANPNAGNPLQNLDFSGLMNNPALLNMASQMLTDPSFRNIISNVMTSTNNSTPDLDSFINMGQQLAEHIQTTNPDMHENLRQSLGSQIHVTESGTSGENVSNSSNNTEANKTDQVDQN